MSEIILRVYLDSNNQRHVDIPITPDTSCGDVVECCKDAGEQYCHLAELWRGCERPIYIEERPYEILQQWGIHRDEVKFYLRHEPFFPPDRRDKKRNGMNDYHFGQDNPVMPGGVDLTLTELQEMATRQQQQIENQQQMLVAKEQRLKFLKQQEMRHQQIASENERLRKLREKVESQELKLKKLRALRGQVDQQRMSNGNLNSELESIKVLFNEKEKELSIAVAKVDELTKQLDEVKQGKSHDGHHKSTGDVELEKLKKELMVRNKLNEQQSTKLNAHREVLTKRHEEISMMDNRIDELQERLRKKRQLQQQQQQQRQKGFPQSGRSNVAAVEPYVRTEQKDIVKDDLYEENLKSGIGPSKQQPRYQTLPYNTKFPMHLEGQKPQQDINSNIYNYEKKLEANNNIEKQENNKPDQKSVDSKGGVYLAKDPATSQPSQFLTSKVYNVTQDNKDSGVTNRVPTTGFKGVSSGLTHFTPRPFSATYSSVSFNPNQGTAEEKKSPQPLSSFVAPSQTNVSQKPANSQSGVGVHVKAPVTPPRLSTKYTMSQDSPTSPSGSTGSSGIQSSPEVSPGYYQTATSRTVQPPQPAWADSPTSSHSSPSQHVQSPPTSSARSMQQSGGYGPTVAISRNAGSNAGLVVRVTNTEGFAPSPNSSGDSNASSLVYSPASSGAGNGNNAKMVPNVPNVSERLEYPGGKPDQNTSLEGPNLSVSSANTSSGSIPSPHSSDSSNVSKPRFAPRGVIANTYMRKLGSNALTQYNKLSQIYQGLPGQPQQGAANQGAKQENNNQTAKVQPMGKADNGYSNDASAPDSSQKPGEHSPSDSDNGNGSFQMPGFHQYGTINADKFSFKGNTPRTLRRRHSSGEGDDLFTKLQQSAKPSVSSVGEEDPSKNDPAYFYEGRQNDPRRTHSNSTGSTGSEDIKHKPKSAPQILRKKGSVSKAIRLKRRVSFDPLALLLDASLEGELELVMRTAKEVSNPSTPNDEGITALHNAICAGHFEIVKFLVEFGCDVNSQDSDGWTPLHCAASCNNLPMVQFLVEHGACIFATTISDHETAAEKCEEDEDGYDGCSEYLYSIQEKLGILNAGEVYALYNYKAQNPDEMTFKTNDKLVVLRKVDKEEREWWWVRRGDREGYIPRNLMGLFQRVKPHRENGNES